VPGADDAWMRRALRLASLALGSTAPNPGVGCVLVRDGRCIGEGRTAPRGSGPQMHAEADALRDATRRGEPTAGATAYVTLSPCVRRSTTGVRSCSDLLASAGIARVVAAILDPHQAGSPLTVETGCCADTAAQVHGGFLTRLRLGRPRITGKWAVSSDGFIAAAPGLRTAISSPEALALSRRRRRAYDAIIVGAGTARADAPALLATHPRTHADGAGPRRIVLGRSWTGALPPGAPVIACNGRAGTPDPHDTLAVARWLGDMGCNDVLVEGGSQVHAAWLAAGLYDRIEVWTSPASLGGGVPVAGLLDVAAFLADFRAEAPPRTVGGTRWQRLRR
jgi:diaminohydroxyphosphoribosylaminopyrimidine deaminase/5-amino-6-(5-phosphoribosylamino)uracil reductase